MKQQIVVKHRIHAAMLQQQTYVLMQLLAYAERVHQLLHQVFFLCAQAVRLFGVDGNKIVAAQFILFSINIDGAVGIVDVVEQQTVGHVPFRMLDEQFSLNLKL